MGTVSVIIPVYNHEEFIGEAIESVLAQSYPYTQIIVVNDGSTDGTKDVLETYKGRIEVIHQSNAGPSAARNNGIRRATGEFICFFDSDDKFLPGKIVRQLSIFQSRPDVGLVHTGINVVHKNGDHWYTITPPIYHTREAQIVRLLEANYIACPTVMIRRELLSQVGLFNEKYRRAEDYDMWLRLLTCCNFAAIPEPLVDYRWHGGNISTYRDFVAEQEIKEAAKKRFASMGFNHWA
jgi:glycosyltransferase involved in cell wall biosynthesis